MHCLQQDSWVWGWLFGAGEPEQNSLPAVLQESYREGIKVSKCTLANLSSLSVSPN